MLAPSAIPANVGQLRSAVALMVLSASLVACGESDGYQATATPTSSSVAATAPSVSVEDTTTTPSTTSTKPAPADTAAPIATPPPTEPVDASAEPGGVTVDVARSLELPTGTCFDLVDGPGVRLVEGSIALPDGESIELSEERSVFADYTGDGTGDALLMLDCDRGLGHVGSSLVAAIADGPSYAISPDDVVDPSGLPSDSTLNDWVAAEFEGGRFTLHWAGAAPTDGECCPQFQMASVGTLDSTGFHVESTTGTNALTDKELVLDVTNDTGDTEAVAACVQDELYFRMPDRRDEVALYQQKLQQLGYYDGEIDGLFGPGTLDAAMAEIAANGAVADADGNFQDAFPDDGVILRPAFERLGIAC